MLAFLDHDDVWDSGDYLAVAVHALETYNADYFFSHVSFIPEYSGPTWAMPPSAVRKCVQLSIKPSLVDVPRRDFARVMRHYHVHPSHSVMTRDVLKRAGGFIEGLKTADDVNLMFRIADVARRIVYRPDAAVAMRFPEGKSFSLASAQIDQTLAEHHAMLDVRVRCHSTDVLKCARSREAWTLRDLAAQVRATNRHESIRLACQALALNPTFGALGDALRAIAALTTSRRTDA